jgi:histidinol-phosphate aminotransferase
VLDFSVNTNAYGPSPAVREVLASVSLERYPDRESLDLRSALAEVLDVSPGRILAANGVSELIWLVALAFLRPQDRVLVLGPTYEEYARAAALLGASVTTWRAEESNGFALEAEQVRRQLWRLQPRLVFLCNPNNPTGRAVPPEVPADWARRHPRTLFVVDEAYLAFASGLESVLARGGENLLVLRSMTKDYALAGLRLGFAVGREGLIDTLVRVRPPWSVNALAQAAGVAVLRDAQHLAFGLKQLAWAKPELVAGLTALGLTVSPSDVHFFLVRVGDGATLRRALLQRSILVRDCASFGLPAHVRIATRRPEENAHLLSALREVIR